MAKPTTKSSHQNQAKSVSRNKKPLVITAGVIVGLLVFNLFTGLVSYGAMTVWCMRKPITGSKFAASYTYFRPGEPFYGPGPFESYYCTERDARNAGLHPGY